MRSLPFPFPSTSSLSRPGWMTGERQEVGKRQGALVEGDITPGIQERDCQGRVFSNLDLHLTVHVHRTCCGNCTGAFWLLQSQDLKTQSSWLLCLQRVTLLSPACLWALSLFLYLTLCVEKPFQHLFDKHLAIHLCSLPGKGVRDSEHCPRTRSPGSGPLAALSLSHRVVLGESPG